MTPLWRKELRDQRPFALLGLFFVVLELLSDLFRLDPVRQTLAVTFDGKFKASGDLAGISAVIAFAIGAGLLIREQDDRTLEFLESMPVSRLHIFTVKVAVALGITLVYPVVDTLYLFLCHGLSTTSLDRGLHLDLLGMGLGLRVAQVFILLSLALALAHFRRLYWLLIGVMFSAFNLARDRIPGLELLNPFALAAPRFEGTRWKFPAEALGWQLLVGGVLMALSLGLFLGVGEQLLRRLDSKTRGSVVGGLVTVATVGVCLFALVRLMDDPDDSNKAPGGTKPAYTFETAKPTHTQTARYRFTYASNQKKRAEQVVERADAVFDTVRTFLGTEAGEPVTVDLTGSARHTAGTAYWGTARLSLDPDEDAESDVATLAHETTHVLAQRLAGLEAAPVYRQFQTFHEGLATYVEGRFFQSREPRAEHEFVAAAMWMRREVKLDELMDPTLLGQRRDVGLVYPLGLLWVEALVKRYGDAAPRRLLAAMGRKDAPEGLEAEARWQDTFQAAGFDLAEVAEVFQRELARLSKVHAAELAELPRPRGAVEQEEEVVVVRPVLDTPAPAGWSVVCRFRAFEESELQDIDGPYDATDGCRRAKARLAKNTLWYQLGLRSPSGNALYEPWASVPVE